MTTVFYLWYHLFLQAFYETRCSAANAALLLFALSVSCKLHGVCEIPKWNHTKESWKRNDSYCLLKVHKVACQENAIKNERITIYKSVCLLVLDGHKLTNESSLIAQFSGMSMQWSLIYVSHVTNSLLMYPCNWEYRRLCTCTKDQNLGSFSIYLFI